MSTKYTHAIVVRLAQSFATTHKVDFEVASQQHQAYISTLREIGLDVIELPSDENLPDSLYVEDTAVICNSMALMGKSDDKSKQEEIKIIKTILSKELNIPTMEIDDKEATLSGGDVLFTGREFFVGLSNYTNEGGAKAVADKFPEYPCIPIRIRSDQKLKYYVTLASPDVLCISSSPESWDILRKIQSEASYSYQTITMLDQEAANVIYANGFLIHRSLSEIPHSYQILQERTELQCRSINMNELAKFSAGVTSCCILLRKSKFVRNI